MSQDPIKDLYTEFNSKFRFANSEAEFRQVMSDKANREAFFKEFNPKINLASDFNEFESVLFPVKKKEAGASPTPSPSRSQSAGIPSAPSQPVSGLEQQIASTRQNLSQPKPEPKPTTPAPTFEDIRKGLREGGIRPTQDNLTVPKQVQVAAQKGQAQIDADKAAPKQMMVFNQPRFKYSEDQEKTAKIAGFQSAQQMYEFDEEGKAKKQEKLQEAADNFYNTFGGKLFYNIVQPLGTSASRNIGNISATALRIAGLGEIADGVSDTFNPEKRYAGTLAGTTPTKLQGGLFNDGRMNWSKIVPSVVNTLSDAAWLLGGASTGAPALKAAGATERVATGASLFGASYLQQRENYYQEGKAAGLRGDQADYFATGAAALTSILEPIFPNTLALGGFRNQLAKNYAGQIARGITSRVAMKEAVKAVAKETLVKEPAQEMLQLAGDKAAMAISDFATGQGNFKDRLEFNNVKDEVYETLVLTPITSLLMSGSGAFRRYSPTNYEKSVFYEAAKTPEKVNQILDNQFINKEITEEQYKQAKTRFNNYDNSIKQAQQLGYSDDQTIKMAWELFSAKEKLPVNNQISADPVLREALGQEVKKDSENVSNSIRSIGMGVPSVGEEISGGDVSVVISNIGDKGVEIGQDLVDQIGEDNYRVEEVSVRDLYNSDPEFKQYVDSYKKGSISDDAKLVPAVMKDNKIIDGRARLAEQFIAGKDNVKIFKNVTDAINESQVQEGRTEGDISQPAGVIQGQQEAGQGTGIQGQAQIPQADAGDSNINREGEIVAPELSNIEIQPTVIAQNAAPFVNDVKVAAPDVETGSTMNIDGTQYTGGGLVVPAASMNTTIEDITPEMVAQFVEQNRGKISGDNFKVGIYKFPNSNRASIDLNIVVPAANRAAALEFGRAAGQESLFDLDTFENVKTGADGVNPLSFTDEQFREIANALANNRVPNVFGQQDAMQLEQDVDTITRELLEELGLSNIDTIIANASQALADTGVTIDVINDPVEYDNMIESMGGQRGTDGVFVADDGKIILNNARLRSGIDAGRVIWHEASHPVMNIIRNTNRDLYDRAVRGAKQAAPDAFNWASENYDSQASIDDETLVEATSMVADGTLDLAKLPTGFRQTLIDFVNSVAKLLGFDPVLNDTDLGAFRKLAADVSEALKSGRSIEGIVGAENVARTENTIGDATIENTENEFSNSAVQARFTTEFFEDSDSFDKLVEDGDVVHNADMSSFDDQTVVIHNPDSFATGKIKFRGKDLVEGEGGIYFVLKFGDVWASSKQATARQMANLINESLRNSTDGKARIVLIKGDPNKNLTSVKGAKALMGVIEILADDGLIPLSAFRKALNVAGKKYGVDFDGRNDAKSIHRDIQSKFMNASNSSFERRGDFVRDVIDEIANQNVLTKEDISRIAESIGATRKMTTFSKASIIDSVAYATTERVLRDVPNSHAYAVIETSSPVEIKQDGRHESYPWHIVTQDGSRPKLYLLKDRPYFNNAFVAAKDTEKVKAGEAFGDVSRAGLAQRGMGLAKVSLEERPVKALQARVSNKSPKKGVNLIEEAGYDLGLTEDGKGNYLFFHFSNKDLTKSGIDPSKHGASRQTSRQEAMQKPNVSYYYTTPSKESFTGDFGHVVAIPKHKVYPFQKDPLNLYDEAREAFLKDYPFGGFGPNQQIGWISKIAAKYGFEMVVGKWNGGMYRGETTIKHKPEFYSKPGLGINTTVFNPKYKDVVPNRKKKRKRVQARVSKQDIIEQSKKDGTFMKAPNGKPTNLTEDQWATVRTPEFKNWFGDWENDPKNASKVVDENGEPMIAYHYSPEQFEAFDKKKHNVFVNVVEGKKHKPLGYDFSTKEGFYKSERRNKKYEVFLNAKNVFDFRTATEKEIDGVSRILSKIPYYKNNPFRLDLAIKNLRNGEWDILETPSVEKYLSSKYDGAIMTERDWVNVKVFDANQIKSATDNVGSFSTTDPRIQMSAGNRDNRVRAFIERKRSEGVDDATIRQAIKNSLSLSDADIDAIMAAPQAPTGMELEEARLDVEGEGRQMERGLARRFDTLPSETVARIDEDAKTYFQQTNRQTIEAVEEFMKGKNVEDVADYVVAEPQIPDASLVFMAAITAKKLTPMIEQARQDGNQDLAKRLADKQAAIYNTFAKKATSLGQAVQAFIAFKDDSNATQFYLNKILTQLREKGVEVTKDQEDQIRELLSDVGNAKNGLPKDMAIIKLSSYLNSISPVNGFEVLEAIWYAKILSGITTQSKNLFANLFNTFFEIPVVATRESIKNKSLMPFLYAAKGAVSGFAKGSVVGADILRTGVKEQSLDKYFGNNILEYFSWGRTKIGQLGGGRVGKVLDFPAFIELSPKALRFVGRGLSAADAMFSSINQEAYANMMAWAQAVNEGKNQPAKNDYNRANEILGNTKQVIEKAKQDAAAEGFKPGTLTFKRRVIELVEDTRPKEIERQAEDFGKRVTLNYEPEGFIRPIYNMIVRAQQEARVLKVWIPFTRIIANLTEQMLNYSPAGYYKAITGKRNPFGGGTKLTNEERGDLAIKATMGLAAVGVLASVVGDEEDDWFDVTANGTGNVQKNYELEKEGWRPFTITLKDGTKINYADWPIRGILAGIGAYRDGVKYGDSEDGFWDRTTLFSYGMMASMYESSLMKGLAEFIDVFRPEQTGKAENVGEGVSKWAAQQAKSVTLSNFTQQALKFVDEYQGDPIKEAKGAAILYRDIPVLNDGLNPIIDVFGDPVTPKTSEKLVPAYTVPDEKKDKVIEFLHTRGIFLGVPKRPNFVDINTMTETPATDEQWYNYRKTYGQAMKKYLYEFQENYKGEDDETVKAYVSKIKEAAGKEAKYELYFGNKLND